MTRLTTCAIVLALPLVALAQASRPSSPEARLTRELPPVAFAGVGMEKALAKLSEMSGLDIRADWVALASAGVDRNTPVQFRSEKASLDKLLDQLLVGVSPKPLAWVRQGEMVSVSTQQGILARNRLGPLPPSAAPAGAAKGGQAPAGRTFAQGQSLGGHPTKVDLSDTPLSAALDFVHDLAGVNIHVNWRALELSGVTADSPLTLKVQGVSPGKVLDLILDSFNTGKDKFAKLYWVIDEGVLEISTGEALNTTTKTQTYDVTDLLMAVPSFAAPAMNLSSGGGTGGAGMSSAGGSNSLSSGSGASGGSSYGGGNSGGGSGGGANVIGGPTRQDMQNSLMDIIRNSIGPDMWAPTGKGTLQILNGRLVISQTPLGFKLLEEAYR